MINTVVVEEEEEEEEEVVGNSKDLMRFLGMKDGVTASMASQGTLSDDCVRLSVNNPMAQVQKSSEPVATQVNKFWRNMSILQGRRNRGAHGIPLIFQIHKVELTIHVLCHQNLW